MRRLHLDYQRVARPFPWPGLVLLLAALLALAWLGWQYLDLERRAGLLTVRAAQTGAVPGHGSASRVEGRVDAGEMRAAKRILRELALPWEALFRAVEFSGDKDVALLSMEPDPAKGTVRIGGEARDFTAVLAYVKQLGKRTEFSRVALQSHKVNLEDKEKPVHFVILAEWRGVAP